MVLVHFLRQDTVRLADPDRNGHCSRKLLINAG